MMSNNGQSALLTRHAVSKWLILFMSMGVLCGACAADHSRDLVSDKTDSVNCPVMEYKEFSQFLHSVDSWAEESFDKALVLENCTGGGSLSEVRIALGVYMEKNPEYFFKKTHNEKTPEYSIASILKILPRSLVDNWNGKLERIKLRKSIIENAELTCCVYERDQAIQILIKEKNELEKIIEEEKMELTKEVKVL